MPITTTLPKVPKTADNSLITFSGTDYDNAVRISFHFPFGSIGLTIPPDANPEQIAAALKQVSTKITRQEKGLITIKSG